MGQRKNSVKICQCILINNCQLTFFCRCSPRCNEISEMFRLGLEEQKLWRFGAGGADFW